MAAFAEDLEFDLDGRELKLEDIWINILPEGGSHASHIHPHSVISGTTYVAMPDGASALKLEDPRSAMMMAAPARKKDAREEMRIFIYVAPKVGDVLLWESWLRHEVPMNMSEDERISVSFNYNWALTSAEKPGLEPHATHKPTGEIPGHLVVEGVDDLIPLRAVDRFVIAAVLAEGGEAVCGECAPVGRHVGEGRMGKTCVL